MFPQCEIPLEKYETVLGCTHYSCPPGEISLEKYEIVLGCTHYSCPQGEISLEKYETVLGCTHHSCPPGEISLQKHEIVLGCTHHNCPHHSRLLPVRARRGCLPSRHTQRRPVGPSQSLAPTVVPGSSREYPFLTRRHGCPGRWRPLLPVVSSRPPVMLRVRIRSSSSLKCYHTWILNISVPKCPRHVISVRLK